MPVSMLNANLVYCYQVTVKRCECSVWQGVYSRCIFVLKAKCNVSSQGKEEWPLVCLDILQHVLPFLFPVRLKTRWWWLKVLQFLLSLNRFLSYFRNKKKARKAWLHLPFHPDIHWKSNSAAFYFPMKGKLNNRLFLVLSNSKHPIPSPWQIHRRMFLAVFIPTAHLHDAIVGSTDF